MSQTSTHTLCVLGHYDANGELDERPRRATHGHLCIGHFHALEQHVNELPALIGQVEKVLARTLTGNGPKVGGSRDESPLPYDEKAGDALRSARDILASWAANVADSTGTTRPPFEIYAMARYLSRHLDHTVQQDWVLDFVTEIRAVRRDLNRHKRTIHKRRVAVGACDGHVACSTITRELVPCTGILRAETTTEDDDLPDITCPVCGASYAPADWRPLSRRLHGEQDPYLTVAQLSQVFGGDVAVGTLYRWAQEDEWRRTAVVTAEGTRTRYHLDDAQHTFTARRA